MPASEIALYSYDGALLGWIDKKRLTRLSSTGRVARVVRNRTGHIKRATLHRMPGEPRPSFITDYKGTKYCFTQPLDDGHRCYRLRALGNKPRADEHDLAPEEVRPIFLRVVLDCLAPGSATPSQFPLQRY